jgi:zinc transport system substrate-binding protein
MEVVEEDLRALNDAYAAAFAGAAGRKLASSHPAYNYLARRYDLDLTAFHFDPAEPLTAEQRAAFDAWAAGAGPEPVLLWEAQPEQAVLDSLPAGVKHVVVDPLEQPAEGKRYDYLLQATANLRVFREIFKP